MSTSQFFLRFSLGYDVQVENPKEMYVVLMSFRLTFFIRIIPPRISSPKMFVVVRQTASIVLCQLPGHLILCHLCTLNMEEISSFALVLKSWPPWVVKSYNLRCDISPLISYIQSSFVTTVPIHTNFLSFFAALRNWAFFELWNLFLMTKTAH